MEGAQVEGIIIIKAQLGDDIRCIPVHNVDITFDELILMMQRVFKGQLAEDEEITIKYKDHDGDLVTITDGNDLTFALQLSHMLRITIFQTQQAETLARNEVKTLRRELQQVRDMVTKMLDKLEIRGLTDHVSTQQNGVAESEDTASEPTSENVANKCHESQPSSNAREFDPLSQTANLASAPQEQSHGHAHSVPGDDPYALKAQQQQQPQQSQSVPPQQPQSMQPPTSTLQQQPPTSTGGYYSNYPGAQQQQQYQPPQPPQQQQFQPPHPPQHHPQQQQQSSYYPGGHYGQPQQPTPSSTPGMASAPPPTNMAPPPGQPGYGHPPTSAGGFAPPGAASGYPGPQPTPPPAGGPPPPAAFGAPPMGQGPPPRGGVLGYGRYQPGYN